MSNLASSLRGWLRRGSPPPSRWGARGLHKSPLAMPQHPSSVLGDMRPTRPPLHSAAPRRLSQTAREQFVTPSPCTVGQLYSPLGHVAPSCGEEQLSSAAWSLASRATTPGEGPSSSCTHAFPRTALLRCRTSHTCEGQLGVGASPIVIVPAPSQELLCRELSGCSSLLHHPRTAMVEGELCCRLG